MIGDLITQNIIGVVHRAVLRALDHSKNRDLKDPLVREQIAEDVGVELKAAFDRGLTNIGSAAKQATRFKRRLRE
jgi:hypothetical protein